MGLGKRAVRQWIDASAMLVVLGGQSVRRCIGHDNWYQIVESEPAPFFCARPQRGLLWIVCHGLIKAREPVSWRVQQYALGLPHCTASLFGGSGKADGAGFFGAKIMCFVRKHCENPTNSMCEELVPLVINWCQTDMTSCVLTHSSHGARSCGSLCVFFTWQEQPISRAVVVVGRGKTNAVAWRRNKGRELAFILKRNPERLTTENKDSPRRRAWSRNRKRKGRHPVALDLLRHTNTQIYQCVRPTTKPRSPPSHLPSARHEKRAHM